MFSLKAKYLEPGMTLVYSQYDYELYIDDVQFTRDGEVKVSLGVDGSGTSFFDMNEVLTVKVK